METKKIGVEHLQQIIGGLGDVISVAASIFADGKVSITDLIKLPALLKDVNAIVAAAAHVTEEVKDLDAQEVQALFTQLIDAILRVKK